MLPSSFLRQPTCTAQVATLLLLDRLSVHIVMQIFQRALPAMTSRFAATLRISAVYVTLSRMITASEPISIHESAIASELTG
jgi:hypothetical protein